MKKLFILIVILLSGLFVGAQDVGIILRMPPNAGANEEFEIALTVNKADVTGFARLQLDMPEGFTVRGGTTQGATFSFRDNKARFLWMSLPGERTLNVTCTVSANSVGLHTVEGSFSYVLNNETQRFTIPTQNIQIGSGSDVVAQDNIQQAEEQARLESERLERERQERLAREREAHERAAIERAEREAREEAERLAREYSQTSTVEPVVEVVTVEPDERTAPISNTSPETTTVTPTTITETSTTTTTTPSPTPVSTTTTPVTTTTSATTVSAGRSTATSTSTPTSTTSRASYEAAGSTAGVVYKVQVGAFKNAPDPNYFRRLESSISDQAINQSRDNDGFTRYTIGNFNSFNAVEALHRRVAQLGYQSFIVAYQNGRKITIRQAKDITQN